ncbi:alpha/beta hydrolase [Parafilimonas sp.]|uniref:alpha/beta hydrolase n=1 Tax=Parafilimonas sp. TaxID=1969739 RepID=UPI003F7EA8EB
MHLKQVLFIQGGGNGGYEADATLVAALQTELGKDYTVHYPRMLPDETVEDFVPQWLNTMEKEIASFEDGVIVAGHSLGASMLLKYLSEYKDGKNITGVFLMAPPFWSGTEDWVQPLKLKKDFAAKLPANTPLFFYQCKDDEVVPYQHFTIYQQQVPWAVFRETGNGGHQFTNGLALVARDIKGI